MVQVLVHAIEDSHIIPLVAYMGLPLPPLLLGAKWCALVRACDIFASSLCRHVALLPSTLAGVQLEAVVHLRLEACYAY